MERSLDGLLKTRCVFIKHKVVEFCDVQEPPLAKIARQERIILAQAIHCLADLASFFSVEVISRAPAFRIELTDFKENDHRSRLL